MDAAAAGEGARLLLIAGLGYQLEPDFRAWMAAHPQVAAVTSWDVQGFWEAEKIPGDGHWTERGCAAIAALTAPGLRRRFAEPRP